MKLRTFFFVLALTIIWSAGAMYDTVAHPDTSTDLALKSVNGDGGDAANVRVYHHAHNRLPLVAGALTVGAFVVCYGGPIRRKIKELA